MEQALEQRGFTADEYLDLCGSVAVAAGLPETDAPRVAQALDATVLAAQKGEHYPVVWLEGASCSGCTESFNQLAAPGIAAVILDLVSLDYSDMLAAGAGHSVEAAKDAAIAAGGYLLIYEGAITLAFDGHSLRAADAPGIDHLACAAQSADAVIALGSCAVNGGWMAAGSNVPQAQGVQSYLETCGITTPVINIPGCPANPDWLMTVLVNLVLLQGVDFPSLDAENKPFGLFRDSVHENCSRKGCFERGEFAFALDSPEAHAGFCLYPLGCRGPQTQALCGITLWNNRRSWCVYAGAPCIGCCDSDPFGPSWFERNRSLNGSARQSLSLEGLAQLEGALRFDVPVEAFGSRTA